MNYGGYPTYFPSYQSYAPNQYGMTQNTQQTTPQVTSGVRLVASKAEVVAAQIPFDGNEYYFKDTSTGKIYVKTFCHIKNK